MMNIETWIKDRWEAVTEYFWRGMQRERKLEEAEQRMELGLDIEASFTRLDEQLGRVMGEKTGFEWSEKDVEVDRPWEWKGFKAVAEFAGLGGIKAPVTLDADGKIANPDNVRRIMSELEVGVGEGDMRSARFEAQLDDGRVENYTVSGGLLPESIRDQQGVGEVTIGRDGSMMVAKDEDHVNGALTDALRSMTDYIKHGDVEIGVRYASGKAGDIGDVFVTIRESPTAEAVELQFAKDAEKLEQKVIINGIEYGLNRVDDENGEVGLAWTGAEDNRSLPLHHVDVREVMERVGEIVEAIGKGARLT